MQPTVIAVALNAGNSQEIIPIPIVAATLNFRSINSKNIQIAYGRSPTLHFEDVVSIWCVFVSVSSQINEKPLGIQFK